MTAARLKTIAYLAIPVLAAGEFMVDLLTPSGITDWVWYVIPLLFTLYVGGRSLPYVLAAVLSIFSLVGFFFSPKGMDPNLALVGRGMGTGLGIVCLMAAFISQRHRASEGGGYAVMQRRAT
jgi:hypothetical protein